MTATGEDPVAGTDVLRKRLASIQQAVRGTVLDTQKTGTQLERISKVLSGEFGKTGRDVRSAIDNMFEEIKGGFDDSTGPLTKTTGLNTKKIIEGLGLSPSAANAIRGRLSGFNTAGVGLAGGRPIVVEAHTTVQLDGDVVGRSVTRQQQKTRRRNPPQKRGPNRVGGV